MSAIFQYFKYLLDVEYFGRKFMNKFIIYLKASEIYFSIYKPYRCKSLSIRRLLSKKPIKFFFFQVSQKREKQS